MSESQPWTASGRSRFQQGQSNGQAVTEKLGHMLDYSRKPSLPMYKDKPYAYPGSRRRAPWHRQKRTWAAAALSFLILLYWLGAFSSKPRQAGPGSTYDRGRGSSTGEKIDWAERQEAVKDVMRESWAGYEKYAWGYDEYHPVSKTGRQMVKNGMGWIIVDALDTLMIMNMTTELAHARQWMATTLSYDVDHDVNVFETTIRMLGGLLSAHYISTELPNMAPVNDKLSGDLYLEKAVELANRLIGAYNSTSGVPFASVNLHKGEGIKSHDDGGASSTAEATTLQLEMKYLSKLTGEVAYWETSEHVMKVVDDNEAEAGLVPIFIYADRGTFRGRNIRLGSRGDSYYEYLIKQYLQTSHAEPIYLDMWDEALKGVEDHLITYSTPSNFTILGERPDGIYGPLSPKMDHLVCFMPGTIALAATLGQPLKTAAAHGTWTRKSEREMTLARELMKTCWGMYRTTTTTLAPEIAHLHLANPARMMADYPADAQPSGPSEADLSDPANRYQADFDIKPADAHNLQRPETVESLFYMWRITGDETYRRWGWEMFEAFRTHSRVPGDAGYASIAKVTTSPVTHRDNMESFWMAETLKYFYLLFGPDDVLPLDQVVFNTEAHPLPKFELGKLFQTGWARKPRHKSAEAEAAEAAKETGQAAAAEGSA